MPAYFFLYLLTPYLLSHSFTILLYFLYCTQAKDASHVTNDHNPILSEFISSEKKEQSFTRVVIDNIKPEHAHYLKDKFHEWTRQLA